MKGDFSRFTFDPTKQYVGTLMQQGRVQVDADWNEQQTINRYQREEAITEVIGPEGVPKGGGGFAIGLAGGGTDLKLSPGRIFVDGILCDNPADQSVTLKNQPYLKVKAGNLEGFEMPNQSGRYLVYLDVWLHHVTAKEDPQIRETALGGVDTTTRVQYVWQVKLTSQPVGANAVCSQFGSGWTPAGVIGSGTMSAIADPGGSTDTPCILPSLAGYQGLENQLYRIEIHRSGLRDDPSSPAAIKWSRDNGSVATPVTVSGQVLAADDLGRDSVLGFEEDQWIEIYDRRMDLTHQRGHLIQIESIDRSKREITIKAATPVPQVDPGSYVVIRRWDNTGPSATQEGIPMQAGSMEIEGGIEVTFEAGSYRAGDYWLIPARTAVSTETGSIEWPKNQTGQPLSKSPDGIAHHFCALALVDFDSNTKKFTLVPEGDCRPEFPALTEISATDVSFDNNLCALPDTATVQDAINHLCQRTGNLCKLVPRPESGWEDILDHISEGEDVHICFQPGIYPTGDIVTLKKLGHVKITGSGFGTQIIAQKKETAIRFEDCKSVHIQDLSAVSKVSGTRGDHKALNGTLTVVNCPVVTVENAFFKCAAGTRKSATCLTVRNTASGVSLARGKGQVRIRHCDFSIGHLQVGILLVNVARAHIEDNYLTVAPKPKRFTFERLVKDKAYRAMLRKMLIAEASIGIKAETALKRNTTVNFGNFYAHFNTHDSLAPDWPIILEKNPPGDSRIRKDRDLLTHIERLADRILTNGGIINGSLKAREWYQLIKQQHPAVAAQGIVIGGQRATDIRVINNTIHGVLEGVHAGVSHRAAPAGTHDYIGRLKIENNTIGIVLAPVAFRERYGIFVGNCNSCIVENNYIRVKRFLFTLKKHIEGIRIFGHSGRMIFLRGNHLEHFTIGIYFNPLNQFGKQLFQWAVIDNIAPKADWVVELGARAKPGETEAEKQQRLKRNAELKKIVRQAYNFS
jgi:hypothetical protein